MSHLSQRLRRSALACALLGAAAGLAASPASAASIDVPAKCKFPLTGTVAAAFQVVGDLPSAVPPGTTIAPTPLSVQVAFPDSRGPGQAISPGFKASGEINVRLAITAGDGTKTTVSLAAPITPIEVPTNGTTGYVAFDLNGEATLPALTTTGGGPTTIDIESVIPNLRLLDLDGQPSGVGTPPTGVDREPFADSDGDPATADIPCRFEPAVPSVRFAEIRSYPIVCTADIKPPARPVAVPLSDGDITQTSIHLRWQPGVEPPCRGEAATAYTITYGTRSVTVPATQKDVVIDGLSPGTPYTFEVRAQGTFARASQPLIINATTDIPQACPPVILPPEKPTPVPLSDSDVGPTSVHLRWATPPTPFCGTPTDRYRISYGDKTVIVPAAQTDLLVENLAPNTPYEFRIVALDAHDFIPSQPLIVNVTTDPGSTGANIKFAYSLAGSTQLKTLTKGTLQLSGGIAADFVPLTGAFTADLTLNDTSGRLVAAGFLPVTAKIGFAPSGKTTGTLLDGVLKTNSKVRIKVKEVKLFGAIPLAGGNNCQTRSLSDINLQSTQAEFDPLLGGPIAGTYKISDLNGCGALNGLVSPLTAGGGNTINLNLAPKPVAS